MNWKAYDFFPVMGTALNRDNTLPLDFSPANTFLENVNLSDTSEFDQFVFEQLKAKGKQFGIGGYMEQRAIYRRSEVFATDEADFRNIHLGIDVWTEAGAPVYAPYSGKIHSFQDNEGFGNYGPTIILEHDLDGTQLFSLYGHLAMTDLKGLQIGQEIQKGEAFCHVGPYPENGDWPPHLHFQLMWDMLGNQGDFPGVASKKDLEHYQKICPDPNFILRFE